MSIGDGTYSVEGTGIAANSTVSNADLQQLDARLPSYMHHLCSVLDSLNLPAVVPGGALRDTLHNWQKPYLVITDNLGAQHTVRKIHSIKFEKQFDFVIFYYDEASTVNFRYGDADGTGHASGIAGMFHHMVEVPCDWLDEQFPGWRTRMDVVASLELSDEEAAAFILADTTPSQNIPMQGVEFD